MKSMTGFGRAEAVREGVVIALQVSSVNRKNLEVVCSLPKEFQQLERKVSEAVRAVADRGRFQFSLEIRDERIGVSGLPSDLILDSAVERVRSFVEGKGGTFELTGELVVALADLIDDAPSDLSGETVEEALLESVNVSLAQLVEMRAQEGNALKADLKERRQNLITRIGTVKELAPQMVAKHRENLIVRLEQANLEIDLDDERVLKEIALFSDRCDITEEITRLESHMEQFDQLLKKEGPVGRPLEFLMQEVGREVNTTGSKACIIDISKEVMEMKNELERIREQIANVE